MEGRNWQLPSPGADGNKDLWKEQNQEKLAAEEQKAENKTKGAEVWARLGHLMYKVEHRTGEGINRAQGSLMGEVP